ncbi:DBLOX [Cordylochernes scorpioides]|uniref:DBLOX n=1 Tax=Cordylochernes scorpioides TaxID=51811 RepID=A0ABY6K865_9ARAC|nr:DBLOX [Cordylochernes scorpioides]
MGARSNRFLDRRDTGDHRSSEMPSLASIHTTFLRYHNRLSDSLRRINPSWPDEKIYQNARNIISASLQIITFRDFLPRVLGRSFAAKFNLQPQTSGYSSHYDPECNPTIFNEFAAAAFRFGHSLIRPRLPLVDRGYRVLTEQLLLRRGFFNSDMLYSEHIIDQILRGLVTSSMETLDHSITSEVTNHLFENRAVPFSGMDLAALNIQRARDHGIPSYTSYREICNISSRASSFNDLRSDIPGPIVDRLSQIYE